MVHKSILLLLIFGSSIILSQTEINSNLIGPSFGFSFLGETVQFGINYETLIDSETIGINSNSQIGSGIIFRYFNYTENFSQVQNKYSDIILGLQTNYHFVLDNNRFDPWLGIMIAYDIGSAESYFKETGNTEYPDYGGLLFAANAGVRYWLNKNAALNFRLGFGNLSYSALDIGFDYRF